MLTNRGSGKSVSDKNINVSVREVKSIDHYRDKKNAKGDIK